MKKYLLIVECAIEYNGQFLIIERPKGAYAAGFLAFPGGKVDEQDEGNNFDVLQTAVKREALEEVGLSLIDPLTYVSSSYFTGNQEIPVIGALFHCRLEKTCPEVKPSKREVANYYWMDAAAINRAGNAPPWLKHSISLMPAS